MASRLEWHLWVQADWLRLLLFKNEVGKYHKDSYIDAFIKLSFLSHTSKSWQRALIV